MRIALIGQAAFAEQVLSGLVAAGHDLAAVYAPADRNGKPDPLAAAGRKQGLEVRTPASYRGTDIAADFQALGADLGILAYVTKIIPPEIIDAPRLGAICFHPSLLPRYRGGSAINWQLVRGETRGGYTVFWTDPGIDTGPILLQEEIEIGPADSAGSLYFDRIFARGVAGMLRSVELIAAGNAPRVPQDETRASYDPLFTDQFAHVDWSRSVAEVFNLIRGADPQPGALTRIAGQPLRLYDARVIGPSVAGAAATGGASNPPGTVVAIDEHGMVVVAGTGKEPGLLSIGRVRGDGAKLKAAEYAAQTELRPGDRLS